MICITTVIRDFINILLVICKIPHFPRENDSEKKNAMRRWNILGINTGEPSTQRRYYWWWSGGTHTVGSGTTRKNMGHGTLLSDESLAICVAIILGHTMTSLANIFKAYLVTYINKCVTLLRTFLYGKSCIMNYL